MPDQVRLILLVHWIFIQALWMLTTRVNNIKNFFSMFVHVPSMSIVLFAIVCFFQVLLPVNASVSLGNWNGFFEIFGMILALSGTALASWAKLVMGSNWGSPAQHDKKVQSNLVTTGPFAFSRNPLYLGLFVLFVGQQIALHSYGIILALPFSLAIRKSVMTEEALLKQHFGKAYLAYQKQVPRFL